MEIWRRIDSSIGSDFALRLRILAFRYFALASSHFRLHNLSLSPSQLRIFVFAFLCLYVPEGKSAKVKGAKSEHNSFGLGTTKTWGNIFF